MRYLILPQRLRQLGDVGGDAPGFVAGEQIGRRAPAWLLLEIGACFAILCVFIAKQIWIMIATQKIDC
jgi:hypothetical protein